MSDVGPDGVVGDGWGERAGVRTHPLTAVVQGGLWAGAAIVGLGWSSVQGDGWGDLPWWVAVLVVVGGGLLAGQLAGLVSWWTTRYVVDADELRIDSGVLVRRSRRASFERIQSVDVAEPALARLAGLAEVLALTVDNARWFGMMGNPPLRSVFETAMGLPSSIAQIDLDQQLEQFQFVLFASVGSCCG